VARVELLETREQTSAAQAEVFDQIVASRGRILRPFAVLLHAPEVARAVADLGARLRYDGALEDRIRELVICVAAHESDCAFEWEAHRGLALDAGVSEETLEAVRDNGEILSRVDAPLVALTRELCRTGALRDETFDAVHAAHGDSRTVEILALIGYYTLLAMVMNACEAC
jgi:4-carboxymuconolactone decarboxylase